MNKQQLANRIWESANKMRSKIEANEYKDYILAATGKSLGSRWDRKAYNHVKRGGPRC